MFGWLKRRREEPVEPRREPTVFLEKVGEGVFLQHRAFPSSLVASGGDSWMLWSIIGAGHPVVYFRASDDAWAAACTPDMLAGYETMAAEQLPPLRVCVDCAVDGCGHL